MIMLMISRRGCFPNRLLWNYACLGSVSVPYKSRCFWLRCCQVISLYHSQAHKHIHQKLPSLSKYEARPITPRRLSSCPLRRLRKQRLPLQEPRHIHRRQLGKDFKLLQLHRCQHHAIPKSSVQLETEGEN